MTSGKKLTTMDRRKAFGIAMQLLREDKGLTKYRVQKDSGVNAKTIQHLDTGDRSTGIDIILDLLEAMDVTFREAATKYDSVIETLKKT